jgi:hypothetical protein
MLCGPSAYYLLRRKDKIFDYQKQTPVPVIGYRKQYYANVLSIDFLTIIGYGKAINLIPKKMIHVTGKMHMLMS